MVSATCHRLIEQSCDLSNRTNQKREKKKREENKTNKKIIFAIKRILDIYYLKSINEQSQTIPYTLIIAIDVSVDNKLIDDPFIYLYENQQYFLLL